jgi:hypothetical protein
MIQATWSKLFTAHNVGSPGSKFMIFGSCHLPPLPSHCHHNLCRVLSRQFESVAFMGYMSVGVQAVWMERKF